MTKDEAIDLLKAHADLPMGVISRGQMLDMIDLLASAIIPTPELREAVEVVCRMADTDATSNPVKAGFAGRFAKIKLIRNAFKEPNNE